MFYQVDIVKGQTIRAPQKLRLGGGGWHGHLAPLWIRPCTHIHDTFHCVTVQFRVMSSNIYVHVGA